jgi:hypothetical protein
MAPRAVHSVFELSDKINFLKDWAVRNGPSGLGSLRRIANTAGVGKETLQSSMRTGRLSAVNEEKLATSFGFSAEWIEWRDRNPHGDRRQDSARAFSEKYQAQRSRGMRLAIKAGLTKARVDRRFANFAFDSAAGPESATENELTLGLSLDFDDRGFQVTPDLRVGLNQVDVELSHNREGASLEAVHLDGVNGNFWGEARGTGKEHIYWVIKMVIGGDPCLAGSRRRNNARDCMCRGFMVGDELRARMTANAHDCFVLTTGKPIAETLAKKRLIDHLAKLEALNGATEAVLGEQTLTIVGATL